MSENVRKIKRYSAASEPTLYLPFIQEITKYLCQGGTTTQLIVRQGEIVQMKIPLRHENCSVTSRDVTE